MLRGGCVCCYARLVVQQPFRNCMCNDAMSYQSIHLLPVFILSKTVSQNENELFVPRVADLSVVQCCVVLCGQNSFQVLGEIPCEPTSHDLTCQLFLLL
uniref:Uncharacterized protein n=1 Tax=Anguilla anguilla TaxID=7936 RepID=A0A0E9R0C5_ANGAN